MSVVPPIPPMARPSTEFQIQIQQGQTALPDFSAGDIVEARVLQRVDAHRVVLSIGGRELTARTKAALSSGETLRLRVEAWSPALIFGLVGKVEDEAAVAARYCKLFRSDPSALTRALADLAEALDPERRGGLPTLPGGHSGRILEILGALLGTRENLKDGLFVRNFIHQLGLLMESDLKRALKTGFPENTGERTESLKEALMRLAAEMSRDGETGGLQARESLSGRRILEGALGAIESHQVLNACLQEREGMYYLQIPLLLNGQPAAADLFVRFDRGRPGEGKEEGGFRMVFSLDMDALGGVLVEANVKGRSIDCLIRCERDEVRDFIRPFLGQLGDRLEAGGLTVREMAVATRRNLRERKEEQMRSVFTSLTDGSVDLFA